jgi:hypothetical protein
MKNITCDTCGQPIANPEDGWVEWLGKKEGEKRVCKGLRVVHGPSHKKVAGTRCQYDEKSHYRNGKWMLSDLPLPDFLGHDGLMRLLCMVAKEEHPKEDVLDFIKRLHIPGYDTARDYFAGAISEGVFEPNTPEGYYKMCDIEATVAYIKKNKERT